MTNKDLFIILRGLVKNRSYAFINVAGLAIGMAVALLIGLWIADEISYNKSFRNYKKLAQVMITQTAPGEVSTSDAIAPPVGYALEKNYTNDIARSSMVSRNNAVLLGYNDKKLKTNAVLVQADFPAMFSLKVLEGSDAGMHDPATLMISRSFAKALFGNGNATGKVLTLDNNLEMVVGGVYADFPRNTIFSEVNVLLPWNLATNNMKSETRWQNHCTRLFVQLSEKSDIQRTEALIKNLPTPHIREWNEVLLLHPMEKLHLYTEFENGKAVSGPIRFVWMFGIIGVFILVVACINFMNLSTARSEKRAKEVGIRKSVGALRGQVIRQFLGESVVMAAIAFILSVILVVFSLPFFSQLAHKTISIPWGNALFWIAAVIFVVLTGILAGSYPAFYLSAFRPSKVLKGTVRAGRGALVPRRILVVAQFSISIALISGTIVVFRQVEFAKNRPSGYTREGLITIPLTPAYDQHFESARTELIKSRAVVNMAKSSQAATVFYNNNGIEWRGKDPSSMQFFRDVNVSHDFGRTIGWKVLKGRDFSREHPSDSAAAVINETTARIMGFKDPVGEIINYGDQKFTIIGVVNDMITQSPYSPMEGSVFFGSGWKSVMTLRLDPQLPVNRSLDIIASTLKKYDPDVPFNFQFVDDVYAQKFSNEVRVGNLAAFFAALTIFIACLGLFGLASFIAEQRVKEIGIRKVLGASVLSIWGLLSKEFVVLTVIAFLIAIPASWYMMSGWLDNYEYRVPLSWWIFAVTAAGALALTLLTISFQAIRAGVTNPVKSLRAE